MTLISISWYLSGMFVLAAVANSAITVFPGREYLVRYLVGTCLACALLFAGAAVGLMGNRSLGIHHSLLARNVYFAFAVVLTLFFLLTSVG